MFTLVLSTDRETTTQYHRQPVLAPSTATPQVVIKVHFGVKVGNQSF